MADQRRTRPIEERYDRFLESQALLSRVAREIGPALDLDHVLKTVLAAMRSLMPFRGGSICLTEGGSVRMVAADPEPSPEVRALRIPIGTGLAGRVVARGETLYSPDIGRDDRVDPAVRVLGSNAGMRSYLGVPLICLGEVIGLIQVDAVEADAFDEEERILLEGLAAQVAGAIESARRYEEVMELERLKSDFVARVSHELRTPITIIAGFVTTLIAHDDVLEPSARGQMLERIDTATARLSALIDELLMVSRLEAGVLVAQLEPVDIPHLLEEVRRESSSPESVELSCPASLELVTDPSLLRRALWLLVDNALKYGGAARVKATADGVIDVVDEGPGIAEDVRDTVFELFTRGSEMTSVPGMGLGLPVARTLVSSLGGELRIEPNAGGGTRVVVELMPPHTPPLSASGRDAGYA
jgi:signal transduction histidine kinase